MRQALIDGDGNVLNIIMAGPGYNPKPGLFVVPADGTAQIGGTWDGQAFLPAPPPPPPTLDEQLSPTDKDMARATEDLIVTLISKGVITAADLEPALVAKINDRRAIRGKPSI